MIAPYLFGLVEHAVKNGLLSPEDRVFAVNRLLEILRLDSIEPAEPSELPLHALLDALTDDAVQRGLIEPHIVARDLFDTHLMGALTPLPHEVRAQFAERYARAPEEATDWYYHFSQATNYIRSDRVRKDRKWVYSGKYGALDITINLSKPEKDPRAIAAAKNAPQLGYPKCQLCAENEGYAGRIDHPARQNHRIVPLTLQNARWYLQYSPYVYYHEHCIVFNEQHTPMQIDGAAFRKLLDFVAQFPHYFVGSNADLPIVGGSILSHEHFQGGHYCFAMERAEIETPLTFVGFENVSAGIVRWPMSVLRLSCAEREPLAVLAERILHVWRGYSDECAQILSETDGTPHNTITPIARMRDGRFELDLVLRNNRTTPEHPLGLFHPHAELHHIKKENIGLIEVMGLAVLPARLNAELAALKTAILEQRELSGDEMLSKHAAWVEELKCRHCFTAENTEEILQQEVGAVFERVLEDAGVYKRTEEGKAAFLRFADAVGRV